MVCECSAKNRVSAIELGIYYLDVQRTASSGAELNMQDKVVVGSQDDALRGLTRFSDNEGDIIWPAWRAELKQRVAFEFGKIGNQIIKGEVKESDVDLGEVTEKINALINALIPRTRAQIQTRSDWMEEFVVSSEEGASDEVCSIKKTKLTLIGKMSVVSAISRIKSSYFESIQEHGLVRGSKHFFGEVSWTGGSACAMRD